VKHWQIRIQLSIIKGCSLNYPFAKTGINQLMNALKEYLSGFIGLVFPRVCLACEKRKPTPGEMICIRCQVDLPETRFHLTRENPFTDHFIGRVPVHAGTALFYFNKNGLTQRLVSQFKYRSQKGIGFNFGKIMGQRLSESPFYTQVDLIIPVPLHKSKKLVRGFNQSEVFAEGISSKTLLPVVKNVLVRSRFTTTQTHMSRFERMKNVQDAFSVNLADRIVGKHVLLVDDVLTTGATLEACTAEILSNFKCLIYIATVSYA